MERTSIIQGSTPVLLVAPHGPDDENTADLTEMVARHLGAFAVINRGWRRSATVDQFKDLANCNDIRHLHEDVVREEFLHPILRCATRIKKRYEGRAFVFIIHGCKDHVRETSEDELLDIVVGYGLGNPPFYSCRTRTKNAFIRCLQNEGFGVCEGAPGGLYAGKAKNNLNQLFVRWMPDNKVESMQLEIVHELRSDREMLSLTAEGLVSALDAFMLLDDSDEVEEIKVGRI
jgi:hypothetical protein